MDLVAQYCCPNCKKIYKRYPFYTKHVIQCNPRFDIQTNLSIEDKIKYPSQTQQSIEILMASNIELREMIKNLQREKMSQCQRIDILKWLNQHYKFDTTFDKYIKNIQIDEKYLDVLDDYNIITTIDKYVKETFVEDNIPIKAFNLKTNKLYVYTNKEWKMLQQPDLKPFIDIISKQFRTLLSEWYHSNETKMSNDSMSTKYINLVKKINSISINNTSLINNIYKLLYEYFKKDIQFIELV